jgi:subtilase family serine protease
MIRAPRTQADFVRSAGGLAVVLVLAQWWSAASAAPAKHGMAVRPVCTSSPGQARCLALLRTDIRPQSSPSGFGPADVQSAYDLPSSTMGKGQTIAIVDAFDNPSVELELAKYRSYYGLSACTTTNGCFKKLNQEGQPANYPVRNQNWGIEETLDVEMASAVCPNCAITLIEANSAQGADLSASENVAASSGATIASNSWICDPLGFPSGCILVNADFNHPGTLIVAAGGDGGYSSASQDYPALFPTVVAVGGTSLQRTSGRRGWSESAWSSSGGGTCTTEVKPAWQHDIRCAFRIANDVAAVADPATGVAVFSMYFGGWVVIGGTSAATPIIAGTYALAGNAATLNAAESLYADPKKRLYDIVSGSNGVCAPFPAYFCNGVRGYDGPTGNGTPHGIAAF